jgi:SAM-dependent methyltransferase
MNWKLKAIIQNLISQLPTTASYDAYYWIQRNFGGLRRVNPKRGLIAGVDIWKQIQKQNHDPSGKRFFEIGTGRVPLVPLAFWLLGAESTNTIDLNPYLKEELIVENLRFISEHEEDILSIFGSMIDKRRFADLLNLSKKNSLSASDFLDMCHISYIAPGDAANTGFPDKHVDFQVSYEVFEHIPRKILTNILKEGDRIIKDDGLLVNYIDYSDHFCHSDCNISAINFLKYDDNEWIKYAGNKYMYMNRLRHDDFLSLYESIGLDILGVEIYRDPRSEGILSEKDFRLDVKFSSKPKEILAIIGSWIIAKKSYRNNFGQAGRAPCV